MTYRKAIVAILGAALTAALGIFPPDTTTFQVLTILSAALTAYGVYRVPNAVADVEPKHSSADEPDTSV